MRSRFKLLLTTLAVAVLAGALFVPVAGAGSAGMQGDHDGDRSCGDWCGGGIWNGDGHWAGTGMWGTGSGIAWLTSNPDALTAWLQLRADHLAALQSWRATYKADLTSAEAQQALRELWTTFWNDMKAFYEQYGNGAAWTCPSDAMWHGWDNGGHEWDARHMWGAGHGAAWMARHPRAFGRWLEMRAEQTAHLERWAERHHRDLKSDAAQRALRSERAHHRAQIRTFYERHHLAATTSRMRDGAGGWLGLGGMWGGFGW